VIVEKGRQRCIDNDDARLTVWQLPYSRYYAVPNSECRLIAKDIKA
jgi:hypothetical protein